MLFKIIKEVKKKTNKRTNNYYFHFYTWSIIERIWTNEIQWIRCKTYWSILSIVWQRKQKTKRASVDQVPFVSPSASIAFNDAKTFQPRQRSLLCASISIVIVSYPQTIAIPRGFYTILNDLFTKLYDWKHRRGEYTWAGVGPKPLYHNRFKWFSTFLSERIYSFLLE